ncbi:MAG: hypothetical protein FH748_16660 [Balneolaceae bacterium]|nr:hypothetical protein [Balneolaceae bacterium]
MNWILEILNNSALSALLGAFAAFLLVMVTDFIRSWKIKTDIDKMLKANKELLRQKLEAVISYKQSLESGTLVGDRLTPFSSDEITQLKLKAVKRFSKKELAVLQSICFNMEILDEMISNAANTSERIRENPDGDHTNRVEYISNLYNDLVPNLRRFDEMIDDYLNGQLEKVITQNYNRDDYLDN